jgi:NAD(P)H dehydrogenase (quinone)
MKVLIGYYSKTGNTKKMAEAIAKGVKQEDIDYDLISIKDIKTDDLLDYETIIFGTPTYYGQMAAELKKLLDESVEYHGKLSGKVGGAFTSSGMIGGGGETTIFSIFQALMIHGMIVIGDAQIQHYGPLAIGSPDDKAIKTCIKYGQKIAQLTKKLFKK